MTHDLAKALPDNPMNLWFLLLFAFLFSGIVAWTLRPSRRKEFDEAERGPLDDDTGGRHA